MGKRIELSDKLKQVFRDKGFTNQKGERVQFHSETPEMQCLFLKRMVLEHGCQNGIEIGLAFGLSSAAICEGLCVNGGKHVAIDKFQHVDWGGKGLELLEHLELSSCLSFMEKWCYEGLAEKIVKGQKFDFAYIDSTKVLDWILTDFFLIDRLLSLGGIIVFDDAIFPGIRRVVRMVAQLPHYTVVEVHAKNYPTPLKNFVSKSLNMVPFSDKLFHPALLKTDHQIGVNGRCVAFKKIDEDRRHWDWFQSF